MKRSNFFKALFVVPLVAKELINPSLPKDKDGFYIDKKDFEKEVRERVPFNKLGSGITIYDTNAFANAVTHLIYTNYNISHL